MVSVNCGAAATAAATVSSTVLSKTSGDLDSRPIRTITSLISSEILFSFRTRARLGESAMVPTSKARSPPGLVFDAASAGAGSGSAADIDTGSAAASPAPIAAQTRRARIPTSHTAIESKTRIAPGEHGATRR